MLKMNFKPLSSLSIIVNYQPHQGLKIENLHGHLIISNWRIHFINMGKREDETEEDFGQQEIGWILLCWQALRTESSLSAELPEKG